VVSQRGNRLDPCQPRVASLTEGEGELVRVVATGICASDLNSALITQGFPIEDAVAAFRLAQDKSKGVFRVVVEPS
jgi:threonine dehydrogenase-like Zn-dependent dehydrogenase